MTIQTRAGLIGHDDNRFLGRSVFERFVLEVKSPSDAVAAALGVPLGPENREALRLAAIATTSPDARVWPLKLCRLLSSYGDPVAGFYGAQLVSGGPIMGPGAAANAAAGLEFIARRREEGVEMAVALDAWKRQNRGRVGGFGVPFRAEDERLVALRRILPETGLEGRPYWKLSLALMAEMAPEVPNVALAIAALLLDCGVPARRCGMALSVLMTHVFLAHALEASDTDGAALYQLPPEDLEYAGVPPRTVAAPHVSP